jgi:hypothetical protein
MKIVNRSHSISNSRNISILSDCALVVSLFENDDFSAQVKFYGSNFTDLMKAAGLQKQGATLYELHSENLAYTWFNATLRNFFEESIDDDFYDIFFSVFNYIDFKNGTENLLNEIHSCVVEEIESIYTKGHENDNVTYDSEVGFLSVFRFLSKFRDLVDTFKENRKKFSKPAPFVFGERSISIGKYVHIEGEDYDCLMQQLNALVDDYYDDVVKANSFNIEKRDAKNEIYNLLASDVLLKPENTPEFRISFSKLVMILTTNYYIIS